MTKIIMDCFQIVLVNSFPYISSLGCVEINNESLHNASNCHAIGGHDKWVSPSDVLLHIHLSLHHFLLTDDDDDGKV
ncbi:hypothetical protein VNO77_13267 [Canavalia gladiata]|uniref:Uncharacterized protein n=1 Tax=Canavalia gladiata TaxID=3824 RepID=A0AAN9QQ68_CANGL